MEQQAMYMHWQHGRNTQHWYRRRWTHGPRLVSTHRHTDRQTKRHTDMYMHWQHGRNTQHWYRRRWTHGPRLVSTHRHTDRQTHTDRHRQTDRHMYAHWQHGRNTQHWYRRRWTHGPQLVSTHTDTQTDRDRLCYINMIITGMTSVACPNRHLHGHHRTTLSGYIFATKARIDNRKKTS